jgi:hypothetical protein
MEVKHINLLLLLGVYMMCGSLAQQLHTQRRHQCKRLM